MGEIKRSENVGPKHRQGYHTVVLTRLDTIDLVNLRSQDAHGKIDFDPGRWWLQAGGQGITGEGVAGLLFASFADLLFAAVMN